MARYLRDDERSPVHHEGPTAVNRSRSGKYSSRTRTAPTCYALPLRAPHRPRLDAPIPRRMQPGAGATTIYRTGLREITADSDASMTCPTAADECRSPRPVTSRQAKARMNCKIEHIHPARLRAVLALRKTRPGPLKEPRALSTYAPIRRSEPLWIHHDGHLPVAFLTDSRRRLVPVMLTPHAERSHTTYSGAIDRDRGAATSVSNKSHTTSSNIAPPPPHMRSRASPVRQNVTASGTREDKGACHAAPQCATYDTGQQEAAPRRRNETIQLCKCRHPRQRYVRRHAIPRP